MALILGLTRLVRSHLMERQELQAYRRLGQDHVDEAASYSFFMSGCKGLSGLTHSFALMAIIYFGVRKASAQDGLGSGKFPMQQSDFLSLSDTRLLLG